MANRVGFNEKEKNLAIDHDFNEINRPMRGQSFKTLQNLKKEQTVAGIDSIRDFLQDTNNSLSSEDGKLTNDAQRLEKRAMKQQFLVNNNLFNPTEYFGGLEISDLEDHTADQRLEDMFQYYLPTEAEEDLRKSPEKIHAEKIGTYQFIKNEEHFRSAHSKNSKSLKDDFLKTFAKTNYDTNNQKKDLFESGPLSSIFNSQPKAKSKLDREQTQVSTKAKAYSNGSNIRLKTPSQAPFLKDSKSNNTFLKKKIFSDFNSNKENKAGHRNLAKSMSKSSNLITKNRNSQEIKGCFKTVLDLNSNSVRQKSANTSFIRNNRSSVQGSFSSQNQSFTNQPKSMGSVQSIKAESQNPVLIGSISIKEEVTQSQSSNKPGNIKNGAQHGTRSKAKSSERYKESKSIPRSRRDPKIFGSFTNGLATEEESEVLFKSYNTLSRPRTANPFPPEENSYILKGILSPKLSKSQVSRFKQNKGDKKADKAVEQKAQSLNSLKFLNDLLNKRKISYASSDHLRMPKKPTFLETKVNSPTGQFSTGNSKTFHKNDLLDLKIAPQIKKAQGIHCYNVSSSSCSQKHYNA